MNEKEQELKNEDLTELFAEICGVCNAVRRANVTGREQAFLAIHNSAFDPRIKHDLKVFAMAYMGGDSKQTVLRKLAVLINASDVNADSICGVAGLEWYGDVVA